MLCRSGDELVFEDGRRRREGRKNEDVLDFWKNAASLLGNLQELPQRNGSCHPSLARGRQNIWGASLPKITISGKMPQTKQAQKVEAWMLPSADGAPPVRFPCVTVTALTMQCYFAHVMTSYTSTFCTLSILPLEHRHFLFPLSRVAQQSRTLMLLQLGRHRSVHLHTICSVLPRIRETRAASHILAAF